MKYRPDIDGLRALAVIAIVAFHLDISQISGGFVGVDVFYVISGFLIGGIVTRELQEGSFSIRRFYQHRLRRILPALVGMLIVTTVVALFVLLPTELFHYAQSMIATTLWLSNIYFWQTANYFDPTGERQLLLHTWSLGVEEQYYLFFPLLTLLVFRWRPALVPTVIGIVAAASFALSIALTKSAPTANFYLLPTRAWELLLGVLAATTPVYILDRRPLREAASLAGLGLILWSTVHYNRYVTFPGLHAVPPCLGTAAVIVAGSRGRNLAGTLLSSRPLVFVGLISYSLYLWHWPIIVAILQGLPAGHLDAGTKTIAAALSMMFAVLSWRFVEKPFRSSKASLNTILLYSSGAMLALILVATIFITSRGLPSRYDEPVVSLAAVLDYSYEKPYRLHKCFLDEGDTFKDFDQNVCLSDSRDEPNVLLIGDSHAAHLWYGLQKVFPKTKLMQASVAGCQPFVVKQLYGNAVEVCNSLMDYIYNVYLAAHHPDLIILSDLWYVVDGLPATLDWLKRRQFATLVAGPDPNWDVPLPKLVALAEQRSDPGLVERHQVTSRAALDTSLAALVAAHGFNYTSVYKALCAPQCRTLGESRLPLMFDFDHLTAEGSELVAKSFNDPSLRR